MLMALLPTVASTCPAGWTSSPANSCLLVPPERSASLFRCVDLCKERGGTPACIDSAAENAFVTDSIFLCVCVLSPGCVCECMCFTFVVSYCLDAPA